MKCFLKNIKEANPDCVIGASKIQLQVYMILRKIGQKFRFGGVYKFGRSKILR